MLQRNADTANAPVRPRLLRRTKPKPDTSGGQLRTARPSLLDQLKLDPRLMPANPVRRLPLIGPRSRLQVTQQKGSQSGRTKPDTSGTASRPNPWL